MIGDVIYSLLSNDAEVSGIVGVKIFPSIALQEIALPYIVYEESNNQPTNTKDGKSELDVVGYDIEIYADNPSDLSSLSYAVRNCLDRYTGIVGGKRIDSVKYVSENTGYSLEDRVYLRVHNYDFRYFPLVQTLRQPTSLVATGNTSDITLTWVDNASGESGYKVYRGTSLYDLDLLATIAANLQTYEDSTPLANTVYYYYVVPYSSLGNGYASNVVAQKLDNITEITFTFDNNLIAVVDTSPYNIDCSTNIDAVIVSNSNGYDGVYIVNGEQNSKPIYTYSTYTIKYALADGIQQLYVWILYDGVNEVDYTTTYNDAYPYIATWFAVTMAQATIEDYCGGGVCADATVNVNGNLFDTVASGGTLDVAVEYSDATNVGTIGGGIVEIPDNRFNTASITKTGQTTSYATGDDGDLQRGSGADFLTLSYNNPHGNTSRFSDSAGGQTYANGEAYDWGNADYVNRLVPVWYLTPQTAATWANAMTAQPYTVNSQSWYIPNVQEAYSICNLGAANSPLNYAPFNLATSVANLGFWTSTTNINDTTYVLRIGVFTPYDRASGLGIVNGLKTNTANFLLIRYASF